MGVKSLIVVMLLAVNSAITGCNTDFDKVVSDLKAAQTRWESHAPRDYRFVYRKRCFCEGDNEEVEALVCGGIARKGGLTIDEIFDAANSAVSDGDRSLWLVVSEDGFYPSEIAFGNDLGADSGITIAITEFEPVSTNSVNCAGQE